MHTETIPVRITQTGHAYTRSVMGREIVYERSHAQVQADLGQDNPALRQSTRR